MNVFALQVDSKLTSFVTALSEISSVTDPTYGPNSGGAAESEISSLTDTQSNSRGTGETETWSLTDTPSNASGSTIRISSLTDTQSNSGGTGETETSSLTDTPSNTSGSTIRIGVGKHALAVADAVVVGVDSVTSEDFGLNVLPSVSLETSEDEMNRCDSPECRPG